MKLPNNGVVRRWENFVIGCGGFWIAWTVVQAPRWQTLNTASALDFVVAETEREAGKDILRTRRPTFGFIDAPAPVSQEIRKHGVAQSAVIGERVDATLQGSINNGAVALSGGMLCSG